MGFCAAAELESICSAPFTRDGLPFNALPANPEPIANADASPWSLVLSSRLKLSTSRPERPHSSNPGVAMHS
jgi:hypothetical protein